MVAAAVTASGVTQVGHCAHARTGIGGQPGRAADDKAVTAACWRASRRRRRLAGEVTGRPCGRASRGSPRCRYCRGVRFEQRLRDGIHSGAIVLAFRRWKRSQVVPGRRYRTGIDLVEVESVDVVEPSSVDASQAREAGYASVGELLADLRGDPALPVYRIRLRRIDGPDPRNELARADSLTKADVAAIAARLARIDMSSSRGPWTAAVPALIADRPGIVSTVLAEAMGWERQDFKLHVRRLKELGLTLSLDVGYQLSPRGESYLNHLAGGDAGAGQLEALFTEQREAERAEFTADCGK